MYYYIEIVCYETGEVIKRYDVTDKSERQRDKFDSGLNINMNHDEYYTRETESETKLKLI